MNNPAQNPSHLNRREALQAVALTTATAASGLTGAASAATPTINVSDRNAGAFWPNGALLAVSLSLMFEGGGQPISGAAGVIPDAIEKGVPDLPTNAFFAYGHLRGHPPRARPHGQARHQAQLVHDRQSGRDLPGSR